MNDLTLPTTVQAIVVTFLEMTDAAVPGLIKGLYLEGSIALGDFRPHRSDVDFVAVMAHRPDVDSLLALEHVHAHIQKTWRRPFFDGIYVTKSDLTTLPAQAGPCPRAHEGRFNRIGEGDVITWHTLAQQGVRVRGSPIADLGVWRDPEVLAAWTNDNLDAYWLRRLERGAHLLSFNGMGELTQWACEWCVLGVSRLHYTLSTGTITSKEGSGIYALATFPPQWHRVIEEALRIRCGSSDRSLYHSPFRRRRDVRAFSKMVIADAHRIYAAQ